MTVKKLIEKLQAYLEDMLVALQWDLYWENNDIRIIKDFPKGDPANPKCEYIDEILMIGW